MICSSYKVTFCILFWAFFYFFIQLLKVTLPSIWQIFLNNTWSIISSKLRVQGAVYKCRGQILAWFHISVTRWLKFELVQLCLLKLSPLWMSDKMSLQVAQWRHLQTLHCSLMWWLVDFCTASWTPQLTTVCDQGFALPQRLLKLWSSIHEEFYISG